MPELSPTSTSIAASDLNDGHSPALAPIAQALRGLRFGTVTIVVQDAVIVQIERSEKFRLAQPPSVRKVR